MYVAVRSFFIFFFSSCRFIHRIGGSKKAECADEYEY